jgi:hypothetical protein
MIIIFWEMIVIIVTAVETSNLTKFKLYIIVCRVEYTETHHIEVHNRTYNIHNVLIRNRQSQSQYSDKIFLNFKCKKGLLPFIGHTV